MCTLSDNIFYKNTIYKQLYNCCTHTYFLLPYMLVSVKVTNVADVA